MLSDLERCFKKLRLQPLATLCEKLLRQEQFLRRHRTLRGAGARFPAATIRSDEDNRRPPNSARVCLPIPHVARPSTRAPSQQLLQLLGSSLVFPGSRLAARFGGVKTSGLSDMHELLTIEGKTQPTTSSSFADGQRPKTNRLLSCQLRPLAFPLLDTRFQP